MITIAELAYWEMRRRGISSVMWGDGLLSDIYGQTGKSAHPLDAMQRVLVAMGKSNFFEKNQVQAPDRSGRPYKISGYKILNSPFSYSVDETLALLGMNRLNIIGTEVFCKEMSESFQRADEAWTKCAEKHREDDYPLEMGGAFFYKCSVSQKYISLYKIDHEAYSMVIDDWPDRLVLAEYNDSGVRTFRIAATSEEAYRRLSTILVLSF